MPDQAKTNSRPEQAGLLPAKRVGKKRMGKKKPCYTRSTSKMNQAWRTVKDADGNLHNATCRRTGCGGTLRYLPTHIEELRNHFPGTCSGVGGIFCDRCGWAPTAQEWAELEAQDPEMKPVLKYLQEVESADHWAPSFEGHANKKKISGKERRQRRFLSKCAAVS